LIFSVNVNRILSGNAVMDCIFMWIAAFPIVMISNQSYTAAAIAVGI